MKSNTELLLQDAPAKLTPQAERELFQRLGKQKAEVQRLEAIKSRTPSQRAQLGATRRRLRETRDHIVKANMALVVSMADRMEFPTVNFDDKVSAGVRTLFSCVDKFDVTRGFKFSTYATQSLYRAFRDLLRDDIKHNSRCIRTDHVKLDGLNETHDNPDHGLLIDLQEELENNRAELTKMEQSVISLRFGLKDGKNMTLQEVGRKYGITKERVRQIQRVAMTKLREVLVETDDTES